MVMKKKKRVSFTPKEKKEIASSWGMKVKEVDWKFVGKIKKR